MLNETSNAQYVRGLFQKGIKALGWQEVHAVPGNADLGVMFGLPLKNQQVLTQWRRAGIPVLVLDYPWWNRPSKQRNGSEAWKISINGLHPTQYLMTEHHAPARLHATGGPVIEPWRQDGNFIFIGGMGIKTEQLLGLSPRQWEINAIRTLRQHTKDPIIWRQKASDHRRHAPLEGAAIDTGLCSMRQMLINARAFVAYHSHNAVLAVAAGVPVFVQESVAVHMGETDLAKVNTPRRPENREQFFNNLAHWQWTGNEIARGEPLKSLRQRGFIGC